MYTIYLSWSTVESVKETNRLVSMPAESVTGPKDSMIAGVRLDQNQIILVGVSESLFTMYLYAI